MTINQLQYFDKLAQMQHIGQAAAALYISQPSLSVSMKKLEEELGVSLFLREGHRLKLTQEGSEFWKHVKRILTEIEEAGQHMSRFSEEKEKKIRMGCITNVFGTYVPEIMQGFLAGSENQNVKFELACEQTPELVRRLKNGIYDVLICSATGEEGVEQVLLFERPLVFLCPGTQAENASQTAAKTDTLTWKSVAELPLIGYDEGSAMRTLMNEIEQKEQVQFHYAYCAPHEEAIASLVAHGFGCAIVPWVDGLANYAVSCRKLPSADYKQRIYMSFRKGIRLTGAAGRFVNYMEKEKQGEVTNLFLQSSD
jgi:DNA-binding transcriptional LysR family regulator